MAHLLPGGTYCRRRSLACLNNLQEFMIRGKSTFGTLQKSAIQAGTMIAAKGAARRL